MSFDYTIVVRGKKRTPAEIRALAAQLGTVIDPDDEADEEDDDDDGLTLYFDGVGNFDVDRLKRGYVLSVDSNRGNRENWVAICEIADRLGDLLGKRIEDSEVIDRMYKESEPPPAPETASRAIMTLEDASGTILETVEVFVEHFAQFVDPGGMPSIPHGWKPEMTKEDYRYGKGAAIMRAVMHDSAGKPFRRFVWTLDGYGRIRSVDVTDV